MLSLDELDHYLEKNHADFELIRHEMPIISTQDAIQYFDITQAAPVFIMQTEQGLIALVVSALRGKLDFKALKEKLGFSKLKMADGRVIEEATGCRIGSVPLIGHGLPCILDNWLFKYGYIYGGSGDEFNTLKIAPKDLLRLNNTIRTFN